MPSCSESAANLARPGCWVAEPGPAMYFVMSRTMAITAHHKFPKWLASRLLGVNTSGLKHPVEAGTAPQIKGTLRRWREMLHWAMSRPQWPRQII